MTAQLEAGHSGSLYTDDLNTVELAADGQRGRIAGHLLLNASLQWALRGTTTLFVSVKNATDRFR